jgi:hypothetical protein
MNSIHTQAEKYIRNISLDGNDQIRLKNDLKDIITSYHTVYVLHGRAATGKSSFVNLLNDYLKDDASNCPESWLNSDIPKYSVDNISNVKYVIFKEIGKLSNVNVGNIKKNFEGKKIIIITNENPQNWTSLFQDCNKGIMHKTKMISFNSPVPYNKSNHLVANHMKNDPQKLFDYLLN